MHIQTIINEESANLAAAIGTLDETAAKVQDAADVLAALEQVAETLARSEVSDGQRLAVRVAKRIIHEADPHWPQPRARLSPATKNTSLQSRCIHDTKGQKHERRNIDVAGLTWTQHHYDACRDVAWKTEGAGYAVTIRGDYSGLNAVRSGTPFWYILFVDTSNPDRPQPQGLNRAGGPLAGIDDADHDPPLALLKATTELIQRGYPDPVRAESPNLPYGTKHENEKEKAR